MVHPLRQEWLRLNKGERLFYPRFPIIDSNKNVHLQTLGELGDTVVLQKSTNLVHWAALATNNSAFGENAFTNQPVSTDKASFYRATIQGGTP